MAAIIPVPTFRSSDLLLQQRVLNQVASDQLELLRIQDQLSTGRRVQAPSQDAPASVRAIGLQRLSEQKAQSQKNLEATQSYLSISDSATAGVSGLIIDMRALAITMADNTRTGVERQAAVAEITRAVEQLVNDGNRTFRGRSLFAGSEAGITPFAIDGAFVVYRGNTGDLESYADIGLRFDSNVTGHEVFGGISPGKQGVVDLAPQLTVDTRLSELHRGAGVSKTSILISDGDTSSVIDVSRSETIGDVIDLIEANPPEGRQLTARISGGRLVLEIDAAGGGNLNVREVGGGTTAAELGLFNSSGVGVEPLVGSDLRPLLTLTTPLQNILGVRATALLASTNPAGNNDIIFEALERGDQWNGVSLQYVDDGLIQAAPGLGAGDESARFEESAVAARASVAFTGANNNLQLTANDAGSVYNNVRIEVVSGGALGSGATASYDTAARVISIGVDSAGGTQVQNVINAINANTPFTAAYDASDPGDGGYVPTAAISVANIGAVTGDTGYSGGDANTVFIHIDPGETDANDVLAALAEPVSGVASRFRFALDQKDNDGVVPPGSGVVEVGGAITAGGSGQEFDQSSGFQIVNGGETYTIDIRDAETIEDLLNIVNGSPARVLAQINSSGTGVDIRSRLSGSDFQIGENGGQTATQLGIRTFTAETALSELNHQRGVSSSDGADFVIRRTDGVEVGVDVSSATTVQDVLDLINEHADNQDAGRVEARLAPSGNGIDLVEEAPTDGASLTVLRRNGGQAAWDLGLIPRGEELAYSTTGADPQPATVLISLPPPNSRDTALRVTAEQAGSNYNGIQVILDPSGTTADASVTFDPGAAELRITIDPTQTTATDVLQAINNDASVPFAAELDLTSDPNNDGSGLIAASGPVGLTAGGVTDPTAKPASAVAAFPAPNHLNSSLTISATQAGPAFNGVEIVFQDTGGPTAASYDGVAERLTIDIQAGVTTANDVLAALAGVAEFTAELNTSVDASNDGSGLVAETTVTTAGGIPETFSGTDVNPLEVKSIFNTLIKLSGALLDFDLSEIERLVEAVDDDARRVNFTRADVGAREQALDALRVRLEDEQIELKRTISLEIDVDLVETISNLTARQAAFEASLQLIGRTFQMSLLQFI